MKSRSRVALCGLCSALIALGAWVCFPSPTGVPLTVQTFFVALAAFVLGLRGGICALLVYLALGAAGMPVFSSFQGGVQVFVSPTGGFLWGFLPMVVFCALGDTKKDIVAIVLGIMGLVCCHLCGVWQFCFIADSSALAGFLSVSLPYLVKDAACVVLAFFVAKPVRKAISTCG